MAYNVKQPVKTEEPKKAPEQTEYVGDIGIKRWVNTGTGKDGKTREFNSYTIQKSYTDEKGEKHYTNSFNDKDLMAVVLLGLKMALENGTRDGTKQQ